MTEALLAEVQQEVSGMLTDVAGLFKPGAKLTLIVRSPAAEVDGKDAGFVMTNDTLDDAIAALQRRKAAQAGRKAEA